MKPFSYFTGLMLFLVGSMPLHAQEQGPAKKYAYQKVDLEEMIRRYISKTSDSGSIEGLYSVSCVVVKRHKAFLSSREKDRVVNRKDNYAKVAILKNWPGSQKEYVELSLNDKNAPQYPIVAEITALPEEHAFLFKHFEPDGDHMTFTFSLEEYPDILQGVYARTEKRSVITYKLSYLKVYPKASVDPTIGSR